MRAGNLHEAKYIPELAYHGLYLLCFPIQEKETRFSDVFSIFAGVLSTALQQHHLLGFEIDQLEFDHLH